MRCGACDRRNPQPSIDGRELALKSCSWRRREHERSLSRRRLVSGGWSAMTAIWASPAKLASTIGQVAPACSGRVAAARRSLRRGGKQVEHTKDHEDPENDEANDKEFLLGVHGRPYPMKRCGRESQIGARVKPPAGRI